MMAIDLSTSNNKHTNYSLINNGNMMGCISWTNLQRLCRYLLFLLFLSVIFTISYWTYRSGSISDEHIGSSEPFTQDLELNGESQPFTNLTLIDDELLTNSSIIDAIKNSTSSLDTSTSITSSSMPNLTIFSKPMELQLPICPDIPPKLIGPIPLWMDSPSLHELEQLYSDLGDGGHSWPHECKSRHKVAVIVPYRDRLDHLRIFLHNMHAILRKQQLDYAIFVVEQIANQTFNRGFVEASRLYDWRCFIFHDVDLLPEDDRNLYTCPMQPRHMSVAVDKFDYKLPYSSIFGGAGALTRKQFEKINGFSNDYWGWGGEDDDISARISFAGYSLSRYPSIIARYKMVKHKKESLNPVNNCRHVLMNKTKQRWQRDGLSNLDYQVLSLQLNRLYTNITVDLYEEESRKALTKEHIKKRC